MGSQVHSRTSQIIMTVVEAVVVILTGVLVTITAIAEFCVCVLSRSVVSDSLQPLTAPHQAPLSIGILQARILEWVLPFPLPGDLPNPRIEPLSPAAPVLSSGFFGVFFYLFISFLLSYNILIQYLHVYLNNHHESSLPLSPYTVTDFLTVIETFKIYYLVNFQIYTRVLLTRSTMLYIKFL